MELTRLFELAEGCACKSATYALERPCRHGTTVNPVFVSFHVCILHYNISST